jgi:pyruvate,orthophosphate dikinase
MEGIPDEWGTAVTVQSMVFGNMGETSATGVCFSRDAATGENLFNGEYLVNAQGEDVVAGIRTPQQITIEGSRRWAELQGISEEERASKYPSMEEAMPALYAELNTIQQKLEDHYRDMQDMEFTVQEGKLWFLQTRNGKRTGTAMVKIAMDLVAEGVITEKEAIMRCEPQKLDELLHPVFDKDALKKAKVITQGLPASPGAACGQIVFHADEAEEWHENGHKVIMVRIETSPEDLAGMSAAEGILTARGGMTSHAAVVARGMGKCCVSGAGAIQVDYKAKTVTIEGVTYNEGDYISLNGSTGQVYAGEIPTKAAELSGDFKALMDLCDKYTHLQVRTNADTPHDARVARQFGAKGIGLTRTEHMFFEDKKIIAMREMILSKTAEGREKALAKLLPYQKADFKGILEAMDGCPVNIRLLDPPLHEFVPHDLAGQEIMANEMGVSVKEIQTRVAQLAENNPMLGHRGCRLGITFPEITAMQTRAILSAACELKQEGKNPMPEIMVPLIGILYELKQQKEIIQSVAKEVFAEYGIEVEYEVGTMIEIPRAALTADRIATEAQYFSFGTNDLTQMTFGYSRDDIASFLPAYLEKKILSVDPFQVLDQNGVGQLIKMAVEKGRAVRPGMRTGICGEHGGEPSSVKFCARVGMNYASCSPFRVPIARLAAAQAAVEDEK